MLRLQISDDDTTYLTQGHRPHVKENRVCSAFIYTLNFAENKLYGSVAEIKSLILNRILLNYIAQLWMFFNNTQKNLF